jgi:hypothetical protein
MGGLDITPSMITANGVVKDDLVGIPTRLIAPIADCLSCMSDSSPYLSRLCRSL